jgi:hypothetical protein
MLGAVTGPSDIVRAWEEAIRHLREAASPVAGPAEELAQRLLVPVRQQAEVLEQVVRRQVEMERDIAARALAPVDAVLGALEQTAEVVRAQARAFEMAAVSFRQASELLDVQATALEQAVRSVRDPLGAVRAAGERVVRREERGDPA